MKNKKTYTLFLLLAILVSFSSCGEKKLSDVIIGKWKVEKVEFPEMDIAESIIKSFKDEMLSSIYTFSEEDKFELTSGLIPNGAKGKWRLNEEKNQLYIEYFAMEKEFKSTYEIEMVDENKIIFRQKFGGDLGEMKATLVKK
jgi:hypothetical protein